MKAKSKNKHSRYNKERYHGPLITNGVSLAYLKFFPWLNVFFCTLIYLWGRIGETNNHIGIIKFVFLGGLIINVLTGLFSLSNTLLNRFKSFSYGLVAIVTFTMLIWLNFIGMLMFITLGKSNSIEGIYQSILTLPFILFMILLFIFSSMLYTWYYLPKNQGKRWRINQSKGRSNNFKLIFCLVLFVPVFLTGYIQNIFGFIFSSLFNLTLSAVIVDALYAAYYVRKYPESEEFY